MQQLELFDYRKDYLFESNNQIAHYYDILKETEDTISYAEHIDPKKGYAIAGMEYEEYICLLYTSPSPRDRTRSRMPSSA